MEMRSMVIPHERVQVVCGGGRTRQSEKDNCDINRIMAKYARTGVLEHVQRYEGRYGDFASAPEYHEACNKVLAANEMFNSLPAAVRNYFDNDPAEFLACAGDPERQDELVELGLAMKAEAVAPPPPDGNKPAKPAPAPSPEEGSEKDAQSE